MDAPRSRHPLAGLLVAQFLGAFNDNAFKLLATLLCIRAAAGALGVTPGDPDYERTAQSQTTLAFVMLTLPLVIFSLPAGALVDRVAKRTLIVWTKALELVLMLAGTAVLAWTPPGHFSVLIVLALMGLQSALFSPAKYGILPELVPHERLSASNGLLELWSFVGIVLGTVAGGQLLTLGDASVGPWLAGVVLVVLAAVGLLASFWVPFVPVASVEPRSAIASLRGAARVMWRDRPLRLAVIGIAAYWGAASLLGQDMLVYGKAVLGLSDESAAVPLGAFAIGVAGGALTAGRVSAGNVEHGLIPLGALGFALLSVLLGAFAPGFVLTVLVMAGIGVCSGLVLVPLNALLQWRAPASRRGAVIALANVLAFSAILAGSLGAGAMASAGLDSRGILLGGGAIAMLGTLWALWLLPDAFLRLLAFLITRSIYRLALVGREHVPERGPVLLAPNHVSFMDGLFVMASLDRPVRFLVDKAYYEHWLLRPFMRSLGFIPVQSGSGPDSVHRSLGAARAYLQRGEVVCIFPEGEISRTGAMLPFRRGIQRIGEGTDVPIVPVHLDRVWGSMFSFSGGRFLLKWPKRTPYPITVSFGAPLPPGSPPHDIRVAVQDLGTQAWMARRAQGRPLPWSFVRRTRWRPFRTCLLGRARRHVDRGSVVLEALTLARALRPTLAGHQCVALLFPISSAGVTAALAVALSGRTAVWLDPRADAATWLQQAEVGGAHILLTSGTWLREHGRSVPRALATTEIEAARERTGFATRLRARALVVLASERLLRRMCGAAARLEPDHAAAIVFAAGERPVRLTWGGLGSQVAGLGQVLQLASDDRIACSPGLHTAVGQVAVWLSLARGMALVMSSGDDVTSLGRAITRYAADLLIAESTQLPDLVSGCRPGQLGSLRLVLSLGTEHDASVLDVFQAQFGLRPLAGLARADLGPIVAVSSLGFRAAGFYQVGSRRGYAGHPLPGVRVKAVDAQGHDLPPEAEGELWGVGPSLGGDVWRSLGLRGCVDRDGYVGLVGANGAGDLT